LFFSDALGQLIVPEKGVPSTGFFSELSVQASVLFDIMSGFW